MGGDLSELYDTRLSSHPLRIYFRLLSRSPPPPVEYASTFTSSAAPQTWTWHATDSSNSTRSWSMRWSDWGPISWLRVRRLFFVFFFHFTHSRWTSSLPSCLWSLRIFPSLLGSRLTIFYRDASSALLQLVNQWLNFTYSRSHTFRYERKNTNPTLVRIELTTSALAGVQVTY